MDLVFDRYTCELYRSWSRSKYGGAIDKMVEDCVRVLLDPKPGERILDIGCGDGDHLLLFSRLDLDVSGIDASAYMIGRARERLGRKCTLRIARAEDLPFDDNEFDIAVLINTLEFLDKPLDALIEAGRVARRRVFVGVFNSLSWFAVDKRIRGYFTKSLFSSVKFYNLWELKSCMTRAFGEVPMEWKCARITKSFFSGTGVVYRWQGNLSRWPVGVFLGVSATMQYRLRTAQHPLKIDASMKTPSAALQ
ncbi:MAG: methyltransferase domain-containing protein [Deltaproteobacteria bacterium]|nr:methyltransferase domain-containing protein [Deltaproteobacteria bacterium]